MGTLTLPAGAVVFFDANALIYSVETVAPYWSLLRPAWAVARNGRITLVGSELLVLEALTGPLKRGDRRLYNAYEGTLASGEVRLLPISKDVLKRAAYVRATHNLKTPPPRRPSSTATPCSSPTTPASAACPA